MIRECSKQPISEEETNDLSDTKYHSYDQSVTLEILMIIHHKHVKINDTEEHHSQSQMTSPVSLVIE